MSTQIDYHRFTRGEGCTEEGCRSGKWYIEDGKKFCQRGHEQAHFTQTQQDEDDWNNQGRKVRKKREERERVQTILSGSEARELYLQCYQLILWKQCHWLVNVKGFPRDLETVVRDLWGLRLKVSYEDGGGERDGFGSGVSTLGLSDTSDGETGSDTTGGRSLWSGRSRRSAAGMKEKLPKLVETLALCYLGTLLMNLPTSLGDFLKWALEGDMVYMRAIKEIPKAMRTKLPAPFHYALEVHAPLAGSSIYSAVMNLVNFYHLKFEVAFPALNAPLLLSKYIGDLGLPIEIYSAVRKLASLLGFNFAYSISKKKKYSAKDFPELRFMSLIVVAVKLSQPFDSVERYPDSESDPTIVQMDWSKWAEVMDSRSFDGLRKGEDIHFTDADVLGMTEKQIDDYLDTYQRTWIDDRDPKLARQILELFPLQDVEGRRTDDADQEKIAERQERAQQISTLRCSRPAKEGDGEDFARPGEHYRRYRSIEELPKEAKAFYEIAAKNIGVELEKLVRDVFWVEVRLDEWTLSERRKQAIENMNDLNFDD